MDEAICPADFRVKGLIIDDELHDILVEGIPEGAHLTAIMVSAVPLMRIRDYLPVGYLQ